MKKKLILASQSPRRYELLKGAGYEFITRKYDVEEVYPETITEPEEIAVYLAELKSTTAQKEMKANQIVLTSDTIVVVGTASDPDGDMLTCWWYLDGEHVWELDDFSSWEWEDTEAGEYTITLVVDDGRGESDEYSMAVTVVGDGGGGVGGSVIIGILFIIIIAAVAVFLIRQRGKKGVTQQEQDSWRDVGPPA